MPQFPRDRRREVEESVGGPNAWIDAYGLLALSKLRFYAEPLREISLNHNPWTDLQIPLDRAKRWHPLNRGVWVAARVTLAGHLLQAKGDRVAMNSSVEARYPHQIWEIEAPVKGGEIRTPEDLAALVEAPRAVLVEAAAAGEL